MPEAPSKPVPRIHVPSGNLNTVPVDAVKVLKKDNPLEVFKADDDFKTKDVSGKEVNFKKGDKVAFIKDKKGQTFIAKVELKDGKYTPQETQDKTKLVPLGKNKDNFTLFESFKKVDVKTPLFPKQISTADIKQGAIGDCFLIAGIYDITKKDPNAIYNMIRDNKDGTVTVKLYDVKTVENEKQFTPKYVTFDKSVMKSNRHADDALWVQMLEKAYSVHKGSYEGMDGGATSDVYEAFLGKSAKNTSIVSGSSNLDNISNQLSGYSFNDYKLKAFKDSAFPQEDIVKLTDNFKDKLYTKSDELVKDLKEAGFGEDKIDNIRKTFFKTKPVEKVEFNDLGQEKIEKVLNLKNADFNDEQKEFINGLKGKSFESKEKLIEELKTGLKIDNSGGEKTVLLNGISRELETRTKWNETKLEDSFVKREQELPGKLDALSSIKDKGYKEFNEVKVLLQDTYNFSPNDADQLVKRLFDNKDEKEAIKTILENSPFYVENAKGKVVGTFDDLDKVVSELREKYKDGGDVTANNIKFDSKYIIDQIESLGKNSFTEKDKTDKLTGVTASYSQGQDMTFEKITNALKSGKFVSVGSNDNIGVSVNKKPEEKGHSGGESVIDGLAGKHAYAVLDTVEMNGRKFVKVANPWGNEKSRDYTFDKDGTTLKPKAFEKSDYNYLEKAKSSGGEITRDNESWMELRDLCTRFSSLYVTE